MDALNYRSGSLHSLGAMEGDMNGNGYFRCSNGLGSPDGSLPTHLSALVAGWSAKFNALLVEGVEGTILFARAVHADKASLPYGHWSAIWQSGHQVAFSKRQAEMLVVIGKNLGWADAQTFAHLPPGWSTLYHLARLDQAVFKKLLEQGKIHPALTGQEAKDLVDTRLLKARPTSISG